MSDLLVVYIVGAVILGLVLIILRRGLNGYASGLSETSRSQVHFARDVLTILIILGGILYALSQLEESAQLVAIVITDISGAFIFTSEGWLQDLLAGLSLQFGGISQVNDLVTIGGNRGRIVKLGLFRTSLETLELDIISVRNSSTLQDTITNHSAIEFRELVMTVHTADYGEYGDDIDTYVADVKAIADRVQKEICPEVLSFDRLNTGVFFMEFGSSSDFINVVFYTYDQDNMYRPAISAMHMAMAAELRPKGVVLGQTNGNTIDNVIEYRRVE